VRKKVRARFLSVRIGTTKSYTQLRGGGSHHTIVRRAHAEEGQTMAEYSIILALVALVAVAAYELLSGPIVALYDGVITAL
jgi:Flp pilus assembly pilin Flp